MEYALAVALVVVASVGAVQALTNAGEEQFAERASNAGAPDIAVGGSGPTTTTTAPSTTTTAVASTTTTIATPTAATPTISTSGIPNGGKWNARAVVNLTDTGGNPLSGASIRVTWVETKNNGHTKSTTVTATTGADGSVTFQLTGLGRGSQPNDVASVTITIESVTRTDPPMNPPASLPPTTTIAQP